MRFVTIGFPNFENFGVGVESEYDIRKLFGVGVEFVGVGVESESEIRDSAHLCNKVFYWQWQIVCSSNYDLLYEPNQRLLNWFVLLITISLTSQTKD